MGRLNDPRVITGRRQPHWLYRAFDADGALLYIGLTLNPAQRFRGWFYDQSVGAPRARWVTDAARIDWLRYPNHAVGAAAEKLAIETERPIHNRQHQPRRAA